MKEQDYIADLFREGLENHEVSVRPEIWQNVASRIDTVATISDSSTSLNPTTAIVKATSGISGWIAGTAIVLTGAAGIIAYTLLKSPEPATSQDKQQTEVQRTTNAATTTAPENTQTLTNGTAPSSDGVAASSENKPVNSSDAITSSNIPDETNGQTHVISQESGNSGDQVAGNSTQVSQTESPGSNTQVQHTGLTAQPTTQTPQQPSEPAAVQPAKVKIHADGTEGKAPFETSFHVIASGGTAEWSFDENIPPSRGMNIRHRFEKTGKYEVTCRYTDANGMVTTEIININVKPSLALAEVPNVFSPNGDGLNDEFTVRSLEGIDIELNVFDQSGKSIYRTKGVEATWNGRINSVEEAPEATYFYVIFASGQVAAKGTVTLKR